MDFFEKIKEVIYTYKINLIMGGGLILLILISNFTIYYLLDNKIGKDDVSSEIAYYEEKEEEKVVTLEDIFYKVDIKGAVVNPGVYELKEKSRVIDVINLAGGLTELSDTSVTNLSKYITDEMVIVIYTKDEVANFKTVLEEEKQEEKQCIIYNEIIQNDSCKESVEEDKNIEVDNSDNNVELDTKISINNADIDLLMTLPGIGESKAKSIIEYREKTPFITIEDIMNVSGIGEKAFEQIKDYITV